MAEETETETQSMTPSEDDRKLFVGGLPQVKELAFPSFLYLTYFLHFRKQKTLISRNILANMEILTTSTSRLTPTLEDPEGSPSLSSRIQRV